MTHHTPNTQNETKYIYRCQRLLSCIHAFQHIFCHSEQQKMEEEDRESKRSKRNGRGREGIEEEQKKWKRTTGNRRGAKEMEEDDRESKRSKKTSERSVNGNKQT